MPNEEKKYPGDWRGRVHLSKRELEVMTLFHQGLTNAQVVAKLWLSINTVKAHKYRATKILGAESPAHALKIMEEKGYFE